MDFMFKVLMTNVFWMIYIPVSFIIGVVITNYIYRDALNPFIYKKGCLLSYDGDIEDANGLSYIWASMVLAFFSTIWPLVIFTIAVHYIVINVFMKNILSKLVTSVISGVPEIKINFDRKE